MEESQALRGSDAARGLRGEERVTQQWNGLRLHGRLAREERLNDLFDRLLREFDLHVTATRHPSLTAGFYISTAPYLPEPC